MILTRLKKFNGQYIGLIKIKKNKINEFLKLLTNFSLKNDFSKLYMTDFLSYLIQKKINLRPVLINQEWLELDTEYDFKLYKNKKNYNKLELI